ncbi:MAG: class I SAM-dependent methyltransferase [Chloroflexota bacterium]
MPRFDADWIDYLLRPERRGSPPAEDVLSHLSIGSGSVVADVGCGPGFFTLPLARLVAPGGRVYALDVEPSMLDLVTARSIAAGLSGIESVRVESGRLPLDDARADLTLCGLVLHDLTDQPGMARELIRITRPGGQIAVVEWLPGAGDSRPNRLRPAEVISLFEDAGWRMGKVTPLGEQQFLVTG